jgi:hypothetical protein
MSTYKFTRITSDENAFEDGEYIAEVSRIERKEGMYGETITVEWHIISPESDKNRLKWEHFNIGSDIPEIREKSRKSFNKFWSQMTDDEDGTDFDFEKIMYKEAIIKIKNYQAKDGAMRPYIVHRTRLEKKKTETPIVLPQKPVASSTLPDDEIPF